MASDSPPARNPGRPPNAALNAAILTAAQRHLGEHGYTGMSIQGVAAAAGTSVPALRRRYPGKPELAAASIDAMPTQPIPENTAHPWADALAILDNLRLTLTQHNGLAVLATVITERTRHPELLAHFRKRIDEPRQEHLREALSRGRQAGQIPASLDLDTAASILTGSLYACYLKNQHIPEDWPERTLRIIWPPPPLPRRRTLCGFPLPAWGLWI
jgi:AcrR family transcriptional regulator